ncbi:SMI1/KNR4 family protein [Paenibacillus sp. chi10]|uniref:SMI1/KNR4 family protein n=1 Tax=Paenibacillus suaedae TaxID=3077233 RepID=A0AAJ2JSN0_9BACL|nr:SMI1/KNR4 family protein [Paenibacillus sp. chi10]MDT8976270.1 SMI1/KNR4 family protein [Paenibacillus sp. chi10]
MKDRPKSIWVDIVLVKLPPDGLKGLIHLREALQLTTNATHLYQQSKSLPYTLMEKVYFGTADNLVKRLKNPEILQIIERGDREEVISVEARIPEEAKQIPTLPKQLVEFINLDFCFDYIGMLPAYYADINDFNKIQEGYRFNSLSGEFLVSDKNGDWQDGWYVFAVNTMDDPFYIDFTQKDHGFPVYFSYHGTGKWVPIKIADTLEQFEQILRVLKSKDLEVPFELSELSLEIDLNNEFWDEVNGTCKELDQ